MEPKKSLRRRVGDSLEKPQGKIEIQRRILTTRGELGVKPRYMCKKEKSAIKDDRTKNGIEAERERGNVAGD